MLYTRLYYCVHSYNYHPTKQTFFKKLPTCPLCVILELTVRPPWFWSDPYICLNKYITPTTQIMFSNTITTKVKYHTIHQPLNPRTALVEYIIRWNRRMTLNRIRVHLKMPCDFRVIVRTFRLCKYLSKSQIFNALKPSTLTIPHATLQLQR